jgi:alanyl-tRNA synthetase
MAERLYFNDSLLLDFDAAIVAHHKRGVVLDRTAFYPESGGQMGDQGTLTASGASLDVSDVVLDGDAVVHVVDGTLAAVGTTVHGAVDRTRRRVHMALHTGQHILSRALADVAKAATTSARLGENHCTIDIDKESIADGTLAQVEALTNAVIDDDVPVRSYFPDDAVLATLELRREAKVAGPIRVVSVGDFDHTPCGGTHCTSSGQVGLLTVVGVERHKRRVRISFAAGKRARDQLGDEAAVLREIGRSFSCAPGLVPEQIAKLRDELRDAKDSVRSGQAMLADRVAASFSNHDGPVVAVFDELPAAVVREIAKRISNRDEAVALLAARGDDALQAILSRGAASTFDCGAFLKRAAVEANGRGGGKSDRAEGRFPADVDWVALVTRLLQLPE